MNTLRLVLNCCAAAGAALAVTHASAAPLTYLGYDANDQLAGGSIPVGSAFSTVRASFEATLNAPGIRRETFSTSTVGSLLSLPVLGGTSFIDQVALMIPNPPFPPHDAGLRGSVKNAASAGRYNTTGHGPGIPSPAGSFWETDGIFSLRLDAKYQAFGFDATDFGDFGSVLTMSLYDDGVPGQVLTLQRPSGANPRSGSVLFYGFSSTAEFNRIVFSLLQTNPGDVSSYDAVGFDQITVGRLAPGTVPEPASLALVGLALCAVGLARKSNRPA